MDCPEQLERPDFIHPKIIEEAGEPDGRKNSAYDTQSDPPPSASWGFSAFCHHGSTLHLGGRGQYQPVHSPAIVALDSSLRC